MKKSNKEEHLIQGKLVGKTWTCLTVHMRQTLDVNYSVLLVTNSREAHMMGDQNDPISRLELTCDAFIVFNN